MIRFLVISVCLITLAACEKSPDQKIATAQEKAIDARASAQEEQRELRQDLRQEQVKMDTRTDNAIADIEKSQIKVEQAERNVAEVKAEVANNKLDAQVKLNARMQKLEARVANLAQRPAHTDAAGRNNFEQTMAVVDVNLADARARLGSFAQVGPAEWPGPYETADNALSELEDSIQKAESVGGKLD